MDPSTFERLCLIVDLEVLSLKRDTFMCCELNWAAWPLGKENCGNVDHRVYEGGADVEKEYTRPHWTLFHLRELYDKKRTDERDLVGYIGGDKALKVFQNLGIPTINLSTYDCPPFKPWACLDIPEGTNEYYKRMVVDLMQWVQKTLTALELEIVTNKLKTLTIE